MKLNATRRIYNSSCSKRTIPKPLILSQWFRSDESVIDLEDCDVY